MPICNNLTSISKGGDKISADNVLSAKFDVHNVRFGIRKKFGYFFYSYSRGQPETQGVRFGQGNKLNLKPLSMILGQYGPENWPEDCYDYISW